MEGQNSFDNIATILVMKQADFYDAQ